jgi:hypothetical protein
MGKVFRRECSWRKLFASKKIKETLIVVVFREIEKDAGKTQSITVNQLETINLHGNYGRDVNMRSVLLTELIKRVSNNFFIFYISGTKVP